MTEMLKVKCTVCHTTFHLAQQEMELIDNSPEPAYFKTDCPSCGAESKVNVVESAHGAKRAMVEVGGVLYYMIDFTTFMFMTPLGIFSSMLLLVSFVLLFSHVVEGTIFLILVLTAAVFLYTHWGKRGV